jgi:protoheme ferro-lyase
MPWIETMREMDADNAPFIPVPMRPFFFQAFRAEYLKLGGSPHNFIHEAMMHSVEKTFRQSGDTKTRFYLAFLDSNPRPDEAVLRAINDGAQRVVVANIFLTISSHTQAGQEMVQGLDLAPAGVPICFGEPLWDSDALKQMFVERTNRSLDGSQKSDVGVLLVGHGQPKEWDVLYPTQTEQEVAFREAVVELFVADGYRRENIALAWMEFKEPDIETVSAELGRRGLEKVFVFSASISASSLHSLYDTPEAVRKAGIPASTQVINLGAWNDDPLVIQAIREKIDRCMQVASP